MAEPIVMPKLAMAMQEGRVIEWLAEEGEWVEKGRPVMIVETEKVTHECEAPASGYLYPVLDLDVPVPVLKTVALMAATEPELRQLRAASPVTDSGIVETASQTEREAGAPASQHPTLEVQGRVKVSPTAKKLAGQHDLDLASIVGTGPGGRIVKADIERELASRREGQDLAETVPPAERVDARRVRATVPLRGMMRTIADHMLQSLAVSAQMSVMCEIDMTGLIGLRKALLQREEHLGIRATYTDLFVMILAKSVQAVPLANSSLIGDEIRIWDDINVGIAVAVEAGEYETGLVVPVVKNADTKTLVEISATVRDLTSRARCGQLAIEDVTGGTITLSNVGQFATGWAVSTPILNQPESVIVQPGGIFEKPVARDGQVVIRPIMTLSVTYDHRALHGTSMARFIATFKELLETPELANLELPDPRS